MKNLPMIRFKLQISGVWSHHSSCCATATAHYHQFLSGFQKSLSAEILRALYHDPGFWAWDWAQTQARSSSSSNGHLLQRDRYQLEMWSFFSTNMWAEPLTLLCLHTSTWKTSIWWRNIGSNGILAGAQKLTAVEWVHLKVMITFVIYWWVAQHRGWVWASPGFEYWCHLVSDSLCNSNTIMPKSEFILVTETTKEH